MFSMYLISRDIGWHGERQFTYLDPPLNHKPSYQGDLTEKSCTIPVDSVTGVLFLRIGAPYLIGQ